MCGIFGAISLSGKFTENEYKKFVGLTDLINYRGIDASGYQKYTHFNNTSTEYSFSVFLGHRRLSIIDLTASGTQPLTDKGCHIIFNGEIFNYVELRNDLIKKGLVFSTETDTEVILKIYQEYGESGFGKFNGMWSFIIFDSINYRIVVSRDRFSIKPLYFYKQGDKFYFSSEIKQLLPLIDKVNVNKNTLYAYLRQSLVDHNDETFFDKISKIPAKHNFIIDLNTGKTELVKYWDYEINKFSGEVDFIELFRELFIDSVRIRLRSDVKVGGLLSGGLDSSAITLIANEIQGGNFESFSVISKEKKFNEEAFVDILVQQKQITNKKLLFNSEMVLSSFDKVLFHQDEPFLNFSVIAQNLIFEKIKSETDIIVVLSGQGGDEILMGYLKYFFFNLKDLHKKKKYYEASKQILLSLLYRTVLTQFDIGYAKRYIPFLMNKPLDYLKHDFKLIDVWSFNNLNERQSLDIDKFSVPALARYEDRNAMAYGLEVRHPFLDHRIVNAMLSLETNLKIKNGWNKYILRQSMTELPNEIRWRRDKKGFSTPDSLWLKKDLKPILENTFKESKLEELGIIDKNKYLRTYNDFIQGKNSFHGDILRVFIAEKWAKQFLD
ncbi:MAG: asparagine synthase (glutamine-hydrolyzing) [Bacteroidota bacterium]|nr:asparagine synthase (glutamine-hydrolyzing) [Bacteroidota bacterium]